MKWPVNALLLKGTGASQAPGQTKEGLLSKWYVQTYKQKAPNKGEVTRWWHFCLDLPLSSFSCQPDHPQERVVTVIFQEGILGSRVHCGGVGEGGSLFFSPIIFLCMVRATEYKLPLGYCGGRGGFSLSQYSYVWWVKLQSKVAFFSLTPLRKYSFKKRYWPTAGILATRWVKL